jgi:hypothetical protein
MGGDSARDQYLVAHSCLPGLDDMPNNLSMMLSLYVTFGVFFASRNAQSAGESQPDRLHGVVQLRSRRVEN